MCPDGLMFAAFDLDSSRTPVAGIRTQPFKGNSMQVEKMRGTKLELAFGVGKILNHFRNGVSLTNAVTGFNSGYLVGIGNKRWFERFAMPILFLAHVEEFLYRRLPGRPSRE